MHLTWTSCEIGNTSRDTAASLSCRGPSIIDGRSNIYATSRQQLTTAKHMEETHEWLRDKETSLNDTTQGAVSLQLD